MPLHGMRGEGLRGVRHMWPRDEAIWRATGKMWQLHFILKLAVAVVAR